MKEGDDHGFDGQGHGPDAEQNEQGREAGDDGYDGWKQGPSRHDGYDVQNDGEHGWFLTLNAYDDGLVESNRQISVTLTAKIVEELKKGVDAMAEHGTFMWNELITPDQKTSGNFYSQLFGWDRKELDAGLSFGVYTIFQHNGKDIAGMMKPTIDYTRNIGARWYGYIAVNDINAYAARVKELGGTLIAGPDDIPGVGRVCLLADPTGALVHLMQPQRSLSGRVWPLP